MVYWNDIQNYIIINTYWIRPNSLSKTSKARSPVKMLGAQAITCDSDLCWTRHKLLAQACLKTEKSFDTLVKDVYTYLLKQA